MVPALFEISVVICTHNPRENYLKRVLDALAEQTLPRELWEILLIDNASSNPLGKKWDLAWHPHSRHIQEAERGLVYARLRGIRESKGKLLVFVDDDNVLAPDYLLNAARIGKAFLQLGAFGGSLTGEFEEPPTDKIKPYLAGVVGNSIHKDYWSNFPAGWSEATPCGAGICVRRSIAERYADQVSTSPIRKLLGRNGHFLGAGEDWDLAWTALDEGFGNGRFASLKLTHLIPKTRLCDDYIVDLFAGFAAADEILKWIRNPTRMKAGGLGNKLRFLREYITKGRLHRKVLSKSLKSRKLARQLLKRQLNQIN